MKRLRLSTLLLLVVIAALSFALVVEHRRADRFEPAYLREMRSDAQMKAWESHMAATSKRVSDGVKEMDKRIAKDGGQSDR